MHYNMQSSSPISVVIPYHQNLPYLKSAVDSVLRQTILPAQMIILDNSLNGDAEALINSYQHEVLYIRSQPNLGLAAYFNECLDVTRTPWCTIMHSDDIMSAEYVSVMSEAITHYSEAVAIFCKTYAIDQRSDRTFSLKDWAKKYFWPPAKSDVKLQGEDALSSLLRANFIMCPTVCYNLSVLGVRRFDSRWGLLLDLDLYGRLFLEEETLVGINRTMYGCRRHPLAATSINERSFIMYSEGARCIQNLADQAAAKGWHQAAAIGRRKIIYHGYVFYRIMGGLRLHNFKASLQFLSRYMFGEI